MPSTPAFGFKCGHFDITVTAEKYLVPGSKGTLKKSMLPLVSMNDAAGPFTLIVACDGALVYKAPVQVMWVGHPKEPQPFLAFKCDDPETVATSLRVYQGRAVDLTFERRSKKK